MSDRINKYLAARLGVSRREADNLVMAGRVKIDDLVADIGARVSEAQSVSVDDKPVQQSADYVYLAFHKPVGYVCSRKAQGDAPTIYDILPDKYTSLKSVGRLDKDSSGLLLMTNDGDFTQQMTHPSNYKKKTYEVSIDPNLQPLHRQMISDYGLELDDGVSRFDIERLDDGNDSQWRVVMSEGRNRQIRRTFAALGYTVTKLHRTHFGAYNLGSLKVGKCQEVSKI